MKTKKEIQTEINRLKKEGIRNGKVSIYRQRMRTARRRGLEWVLGKPKVKKDA